MAVNSAEQKRLKFRGPAVNSSVEYARLKEDLSAEKDRTKQWKKWGPYLSERQWATVREDYSTDGTWSVSYGVY